MPDTPRLQRPPWHAFLTIDLIIKVANKTVLHPFFAWMLPLCLRAVTIPYDHISFQITAAYASLLTLLSILSVFNRRIAFGIPREVDLSEEVIVITGGASGLGLLIADFYRMHGASVAVLDVKKMEEDEAGGTQYYECDVGDAAKVASVAEKIKKDLGVPTVLINNAAVLNGKSILNLSNVEIERNFRVNLLSHFHTVRAFLPGMLEEGRGTIVTVGSVLGYLGCCNLSDYTAAKAGLLAFHASLTAELKYSEHPSAHNIKTVLVAPGQLDTPLFAGVSTPSNFLAPVYEPVDLARQIVQMINEGESGEVRSPFYAGWIPVLAALPVGIQALLRQWSGLDRAMQTFSKQKLS